MLKKLFHYSDNFFSNLRKSLKKVCRRILIDIHFCHRYPITGVSVSIYQYNSTLHTITDTSAQNPLLSLFLHLEAQRLDGADNLFGGGGSCHGDEAAGKVCIYVLGAG